MPVQIGRYHILERRGAGGMGTVYKAHDPQLERAVALKLPRFEGPEHALGVRRQRFQREARAAAQVWHPHVCPIFDVGEYNGQPFVVMAYLDGPSLAERLEARGRFESVGEAVILVRQVLDALDAIHARGIIHRDLKPGNIMIDAAGRAIVTDFGLARPEQDAEHLTSEGLIVGTPAYMAPEQAAGQAERIGPWTDLYSLGVVLYQMLTGRLPFEGPGLTIFAKILNETAAAPSSLRPELGGELDAIVRTAMTREEKERYQSARQFDADLALWCQSLSEDPLIASGPTPFRTTSWRHPIAPSALVASREPPSSPDAVTTASLPGAATPSTSGKDKARRPRIGWPIFVGGAIGLAFVVFPLAEWVSRNQHTKGRDEKKTERPLPQPAVKREVIENGKAVPEAELRRRKEEDLAVRLDAAIKIQFQADKDQALAQIVKEAAQAGFDKLVKKGIAEIGLLYKDDAAAECAEKLARAGQKRAALEVAQMIGNFFKRDAALKKVALESN
jgi:serine/threonine protein kinase